MTVEAYGCPREGTEDMSGICQFLDNMPEKLEMTKIMPPYVFKYVGVIPEDWGISGVVLIAESHIAIHSFPDKGFITLDIFSCKEFDIQNALKVFVDQFNPTRVEDRLVMRGREFPKSTNRAAEIIQNDRERMAV